MSPRSPAEEASRLRRRWPVCPHAAWTREPKGVCSSLWSSWFCETTTATGMDWRVIFGRCHAVTMCEDKPRAY